MDLCTMRRDLDVGEEAGFRYGETRDLATAAYVTQARGRKGKEGKANNRRRRRYSRLQHAPSTHLPYRKT